MRAPFLQGWLTIPLGAEQCRLTIPHDVLCRRFLAVCVTCIVPNMEADPGFQGCHDVTGASTSPTRHPISAHRVMYELRIYSLEEATFGSVLASHTIKAAHCLPSIQMLPRGRGYRYPPGHGMLDASMQGMSGSMLSVPYEIGGLPLRDAGMSQPIPIGALASALANASPTEQRMMLGENLYPLVEQLEREMAAKVTGMLLEMDQTEVLHLLESPEALNAKVAEAMEVLRNVSQQQEQAGNSADQLASLSLKE